MPKLVTLDVNTGLRLNERSPGMAGHRPSWCHPARYTAKIGQGRDGSPQRDRASGPRVLGTVRHLYLSPCHKAGEHPPNLIAVTVDEGTHNAGQSSAITRESPRVDRRLRTCLVPTTPG